MNKYPAIYRMTLILNYIKGTFRTKKQIILYLEENDIHISNKTLERDFNFLRDLGYEIYNTANSYIIHKQY